jgi:hypothetical protein
MIPVMLQAELSWMLSYDVLDNFTGHIGQAEIATVVIVGQACVIDSQ